MRLILADMSVLAAKRNSLKAQSLYFSKVKDFHETYHGKKIKQDNTGDLSGAIEVSFKEPSWSKR